MPKKNNNLQITKLGETEALKTYATTHSNRSKRRRMRDIEIEDARVRRALVREQKKKKRQLTQKEINLIEKMTRKSLPGLT